MPRSPWRRWLIEPIDGVAGHVLDILEVLPGAAVTDQLGLVEPALRLGQRIDAPIDGQALPSTEMSPVEELGVGEGQALVFVRGSTAAISTMEHEPGGVQDLQAMLERLIPTRGDYEHNRLNHDSNSHAHQRATIVGPSEAVPVIDGRLGLGTWQQLVLIDFDDRPRERTVVVQVSG